MNPILTLSDQDMVLSDSVAHGRNDEKEKRRVIPIETNEKYTNLGAHLIGIRGEIAVGRYYGLTIDLSYSLRGDRGRGDLVHPTSGRIEVKTRGRRGYDFALQNISPPEFEVGALVYELKPGTYEFWGIIGVKRFKRLMIQKDYGYGDRLVVEARHFSHASGIEKVFNDPSKWKLTEEYLA